MLSARAIALEGIGFTPRFVAMRGFWALVIVDSEIESTSSLVVNSTPLSRLLATSHACSIAPFATPTSRLYYY